MIEKPEFCIHFDLKKYAKGCALGRRAPRDCICKSFLMRQNGIEFSLNTKLKRQKNE